MKQNTTKIQKLEGGSEELATLAKQRGGFHVSIYLPVLNSAPESAQNPIHLQSLIDKASETIRHGGEACILDAATIPGNEGVAATVRF